MSFIQEQRKVLSQDAKLILEEVSALKQFMDLGASDIKKLEELLNANKSEFTWSDPKRIDREVIIRGTHSEGFHVDIVGHSITIYKNDGRLRIPEKTKYKVFIGFRVPYVVTPQTTTVYKDIGSATGEGHASKEKIEASKKKASQYVQKLTGKTLDQFDFKS